MKKLFAICLSLIMVLMSFSLCFADDWYIIDPYSGEVVDSANKKNVAVVRISAQCTYSKTDGMYNFMISGTGGTNIMCSVYDGMVVTEPVTVIPDNANLVDIYREGVIIDYDEYSYITTPGTYLVRDRASDQQVMSFTIVNNPTGTLYSYRVPSIFSVYTIVCNGNPKTVHGNDVDLSEEGTYTIEYGSTALGKSYVLELDIDHTAPELIIYGVQDGIARGAVTFGPLEKKSTLTLEKDRNIIAVPDEIVTAGQYVASYSDEAGNTNTYYFTVRVFFDITSWTFIMILLLIVALVTGYMIYLRKHMRTR